MFLPHIPLLLLIKFNIYEDKADVLFIFALWDSPQVPSGCHDLDIQSKNTHTSAHTHKKKTATVLVPAGEHCNEIQRDEILHNLYQGWPYHSEVLHYSSYSSGGGLWDIFVWDMTHLIHHYRMKNQRPWFVQKNCQILLYTSSFIPGSSASHPIDCRRCFDVADKW